MQHTQQHHELSEGQFTAIGIIAVAIIVCILVLFA